jgi:hypothetical protein
MEITHKCPWSVWRRYLTDIRCVRLYRFDFKKADFNMELGAFPLGGGGGKLCEFFACSTDSDLSSYLGFMKALTDAIRQKSLEIFWSRTIYARLVSPLLQCFSFLWPNKICSSKIHHILQISLHATCASAWYWRLGWQSIVFLQQVKFITNRQQVQQTSQIAIQEVLQPTAVQL